MRVGICVAGLALLLIAPVRATIVDKGADAQKSCELLVQKSFHDQTQAQSAGACEGMIETAMLFAPNLPAEVRACPPAQGSIVESARILLQYIDNNPDRLSEPGITLALAAFRDAWPCHGDDVGNDSRPKKRAAKKPKPVVPSAPQQ